MLPGRGVGLGVTEEPGGHLGGHIRVGEFSVRRVGVGLPSQGTSEPFPNWADSGVFPSQLHYLSRLRALMNLVICSRVCLSLYCS